MVRRRLGHVQIQESPQAQRIRDPPRNPPLRRQTLEVADEQQPEIPPRTQTRPAQPRRIEHRAQPLHKGIEPGLLQDLVQPFEKRDVPRSSEGPLWSPTSATAVAPPASCPLPCRQVYATPSTSGRLRFIDFCDRLVGTTVSRSSLARVNAEQPYTLYETLFGRLLSRCRQCAPRHGFRFKNKLYAVDATTIDLCLAVFPWASFRRTKAAIKLHVGLDQAGHLPSFVSVTEGKTGDVKVARTWTFPAGSVVVADRAYLDFKWFHQLQARGVTFVTRLKRGVRYRVTREHDVRPGTGVLSDQTIELTSARSRKAYAAPLRRVAYQDPVTKNRYVFVTNNTTWVAQTIADIYKSRWQIELFFKWIKQHLKVKRFVGRSKNTVMTQLWVAMCMYLLLAYLKFVMRLRWSLHQMLQVLQLNMFERRPLQDLFTTPSLPAPSGSQLSLAWS